MTFGEHIEKLKELDAALDKLAKMQHPMVERILRNKGYTTEACAVAAVVQAYKAIQEALA